MAENSIAKNGMDIDLSAQPVGWSDAGAMAMGTAVGLSGCLGRVSITVVLITFIITVHGFLRTSVAHLSRLQVGPDSEPESEEGLY